MITLQHFLETHELDSEQTLRNHLKVCTDDPSQNQAYWLVVDDEPIMALFTRGHLACLYYEPDVLWSHDPTADDFEIEFTLENGQVDPLPADVAINTQSALETFIHFYNTQTLSDKIQWSET